MIFSETEFWMIGSLITGFGVLTVCVCTYCKTPYEEEQAEAEVKRNLRVIPPFENAVEGDFAA